MHRAYNGKPRYVVGVWGHHSESRGTGKNRKYVIFIAILVHFTLLIRVQQDPVLLSLRPSTGAWLKASFVFIYRTVTVTDFRYAFDVSHHVLPGGIFDRDYMDKIRAYSRSCKFRLQPTAVAQLQHPGLFACDASTILMLFCFVILSQRA